MAKKPNTPPPANSDRRISHPAQLDPPIAGLDPERPYLPAGSQRFTEPSEFRRNATEPLKGTRDLEVGGADWQAGMKAYQDGKPQDLEQTTEWIQGWWRAKMDHEDQVRKA